jgi:small-conductance mechanosensitive channel
MAAPLHPHRPTSFAGWVVSVFVVLVGGAIGVLLVFELNRRVPLPGELPLLLYVSVGVATAILLIEILTHMVRLYLVPRANPTVGATIRQLFHVLAYVGLIFGVLTVIGVNVTGALVGAGFLGIVLGLASQVVLGNFFGGLALLAARPFSVGDRITLVAGPYSLSSSTFAHEARPAGYVGRVSEIALMYTQFAGENGVPFFVPNGVLIQSMIINHSRAPSRTVRTRFSVRLSLSRHDLEARVDRALESLPGIDQRRIELRVVDMGPQTYDVVLIVPVATLDEEEARGWVLERLLTLAPDLSPTPPTGAS